MSQILRYKKSIIVGSILFAIISFYYYFIRDSSSSELISTKKEEESFTMVDTEVPITVTAVEEKEVPSTLVIDIKGAIVKPGVYEMQSGARVHQLIKEAGGLKNDADELAINLAAPLEDGMVVYIPTKGEVSENPLTATTPNEQEGNQEKVNINLATSEELQTLTGIGPSKADAIITYREENGDFKSPEGLMEVSGIGEKSFEKIKGEITIK
jgi:competence protein ComEA